MPHFSKDSLSRSLPREGVAYAHLPELGGRRRPVPGSPNVGWRSKGFQGYADHMLTPEFEKGLIPGFTLVPSGVLAVSRAQEKGKCTYCYAG